jgi:hypothetical protein
MVIVINEFYYRSSTCQWKGFDFCGCRLVDKDGSFYSMHQNYNRGRDSKTISWQYLSYYGLPNDIVLDRGTQFTSNFWRGLFQLLGVKINLFIVYHPQTYEQTERVNKILKQYLRCIVNYQQDDWANLLPLAEFAYNNTLHSSTKQTPFFSNYGHHPWVDPFQVKDVGSPIVEDLAAYLAAIHDELAFQLYEAQDCYKDYVDRNWKLHPNFHIEDHVWLLQRNIQTKRPSKKLDY